MRQLQAVVDQRQPFDLPGTSRFLGTVYDGGAIPDSAPAVFLTHPTTIGASDAEGATPSFLADTSASVPVIVIGHVPLAGDILPAFAVGGRWVAERAETPTCHASFVIGGCICGISGATVTVKTAGGVVVDSGTTDGTGTVILNIGAAGSYTVVISASDYTTRTLTSQSLACGHTYSYTLTPTTGNDLTLSWNCPAFCSTLQTGSVTLAWNGSSWASAVGALFQTSMSCEGFNANAFVSCVGGKYSVTITLQDDVTVLCAFDSSTATSGSCDPIDYTWSPTGYVICDKCMWTLTG